MSGWNGQFNARLQRLEKKAAEGGGGSSGGLVEIKNVEPFQVPDLVNGGTRLFDPANDTLYFTSDPIAPYQTLDLPFYVSNDTPPVIITMSTPDGETTSITTAWYELVAYDKSLTTIADPQFCIKQSTYYGFESGPGSGYIIKPDSIVYRNTGVI